MTWGAYSPHPIFKVLEIDISEAFIIDHPVLKVKRSQQNCTIIKGKKNLEFCNIKRLGNLYYIFYAINM